MVAGTIPIKTAQGLAELGARERHVSQRHRTVLFLADGRRTEAEVRRMAQQAGVPDGCFDDLVELGLIALADPGTTGTAGRSPAPPTVLDVELPLPGPDARAAEVAESLLPAARTLAPSSIAAESTRVPLVGGEAIGAWLGTAPADAPPAPADAAFTEAQTLLLRAVRSEAPLAGSLTSMRLRRAANRDELIGLLREVEGHIVKPRRSLAAQQTLQRVRLLLDGRLEPSLVHDDGSSA